MKCRRYKRAYRYDADINIKHKVSLIFTTEIIFIQAREIFFRYNKDKKWSFTDCVSFALMKDLGIKEVLSFDHNFKEMGFRIIVKPGENNLPRIAAKTGD